MVAIVISSLLLIGVVEIFINSRESYKLDEGLSRVQESGRFATDFLDRAVRMAGNMGCLANIKPGNIDNYLVGGGGAPFDITRGIEGFEANGTNPTQIYSLAASYPVVTLSASNADWSPTLNTGLLPVGQAVPGSDILVVRSLSFDTTAVSASNSTANVFVKLPNTLDAGQVVMLTDCVRVAIFQINSTSNGGGQTTITHTPAGSPGNICPVWGSNLCPNGRIFTNGAEVGVLQVSVFYVGRGADGTSSLFEQRFDKGPGTPPNELVTGIENMQVLYGVDTDADKPAGKPSHNADTYLPANLVTDWTRVVSARISLLARTYNVDRTAVDTTQDLSTYNLAGTFIDPVANPNDKQRRRVFNVTIKLRNR